MSAYPEHPWICFHCGDRFYSALHAAEHFGADQSATPACKLTASEGHLITYIRRLEADLEEMRDERDPLYKAWQAKECEHREALRAAEERGYNRGVQDAKAMFEGGTWKSEMIEPKP